MVEIVKLQYTENLLWCDEPQIDLWKRDDNKDPVIALAIPDGEGYTYGFIAVQVTDEMCDEYCKIVDVGSQIDKLHAFLINPFLTKYFLDRMLVYIDDEECGYVDAEVWDKPIPEDWLPKVLGG